MQTSAEHSTVVAEGSPQSMPIIHNCVPQLDFDGVFSSGPANRKNCRRSLMPATFSHYRVLVHKVSSPVR
ncbi:hypothetical protein Pan44_03590 [Caulifigura coniformis]|uniref:Uncharacterized protein n=1 Tax=Caulifigura coniformis TaxID=2527983 RepID=A0A517S8A2_9PLAN|nr:hypothetical protein Pan44_03590 [Caulifigura coniformis]